MRIFLDTNVLVSAAATRGLCADVLREALRSHQLIISDLLLNEIERALQRKLRVPSELVVEFIDMLRQDSDFSSPGKRYDVSVQDRDDLAILSAALNGKAAYFVTGDKELLELGKIARMEIVSPRKFWEKLRSPLSPRSRRA